jgi:multidrug efflux pump
MIPLTRSVLWGPMAVAIMAGLVVATGLTVLGAPAICAAWYRLKHSPVQPQHHRQNTPHLDRDDGL